MASLLCGSYYLTIRDNQCNMTPTKCSTMWLWIDRKSSAVSSSYSTRLRYIILSISVHFKSSKVSVIVVFNGKGDGPAMEQPQDETSTCKLPCTHFRATTRVADDTTRGSRRSSTLFPSWQQILKAFHLHWLNTYSLNGTTKVASSSGSLAFLGYSVVLVLLL